MSIGQTTHLRSLIRPSISSPSLNTYILSLLLRASVSVSRIDGSVSGWAVVRASKEPLSRGEVDWKRAESSEGDVTTEDAMDIWKAVWISGALDEQEALESIGLAAVATAGSSMASGGVAGREGSSGWW